MDIERPTLLEQWYPFFYRALDSRTPTFSSGTTHCKIVRQTLLGKTKVDVSRNSCYSLVVANGDKLPLIRTDDQKRTFTLASHYLIFGNVEAMMMAILTKGGDPECYLAPDGNHIVWKGHKFAGRLTGLPSKYSEYFREGVLGSNIRINRLGVTVKTKQLDENLKENQHWALTL